MNADKTFEDLRKRMESNDWDELRKGFDDHFKDKHFFHRDSNHNDCNLSVFKSFPLIIVPILIAVAFVCIIIFAIIKNCKGPKWTAHAPPSTISSSMNTVPSSVHWQANGSNDQVSLRGLSMHQAEPSSVNFQPNPIEDHVFVHESSADRVTQLHAISPYVIKPSAPPCERRNSSDSGDPPSYESVVGSNYYRK